jgi:hypothetical protein
VQPLVEDEPVSEPVDNPWLVFETCLSQRHWVPMDALIAFLPMDALIALLPMDALIALTHPDFRWSVPLGKARTQKSVAGICHSQV